MLEALMRLSSAQLLGFSLVAVEVFAALALAGHFLLGTARGASPSAGPIDRLGWLAVNGAAATAALLVVAQHLIAERIP